MPPAISPRRVCVPLRALGVAAWAIARLSAGQDGPDHSANPTPGFALVDRAGVADIVVDPADYAVVKLAANLLADDVSRVTGQRPAIRENTAQSSRAVLIGTLGHCARLDELARAGKLDHLETLQGGWETTLLQIVERPWPGLERVLVLVGSDRRGAAYGAMELSERIGVSPWYWWADVPVPPQQTLSISLPTPVIRKPSVKYRGIFINDEDWGLKPWAARTFDPEFKNIGPKTYIKVFELMLRLRLNYLWPAMHPCSAAFDSVPESAALADQYAIVMGSSHCEPMLRNNVWWPHENGPWRYDQNRDQIYAYWEQAAKDRGRYEAVWTEGIRGIHDAGMQGPPDVPGRVALLGQIIVDERKLIAQYVTPKWGPVAQCFVPYKEVQPLYDAGLEVPPDVTLVWADDNFGYLRRLSNPVERQRPGGAGFYYHLSYFGSPQSYLWLDTTSPALIWEETRKAWDNDARTLWIVNVGDIKPGEVGIDFWSRLAWNVDAYGSDAQPRFLRDFAARNFGSAHADAVAALYGEFYRLGQMRKPEFMSRDWAAALPSARADALWKAYAQLLDEEKTLAVGMPPAARDAWTELAGYPARMLAATGLIFLEDRLARIDPTETAHAVAVQKWRAFIGDETAAYNEQVAGGKWRHIMASGEMQGVTKNKGWKTWAEIHWPWLEATPAATSPGSGSPDKPPVSKVGRTVPAAGCSRRSDGPGVRWTVIAGLGNSAGAMALEPATAGQTANAETLAKDAPALEYDFEQPSDGDAQAVIWLLPTFRLYPGMKLRLAITLDDEKPRLMEVPGSSGSETETGTIRRDAVRDNRVALPVPFTRLARGRHTLRIQPADPGAVIDEITLPQG